MKKQILKTTLILFLAAAGMNLTVGAAESTTNGLTPYEQLIQTKKTLRFHEDGTFKILVFSDIHSGGDHLPETVITNIQTLVARENPDLVFFDGDNHWGHNITAESLRSCLKDMVGCIESRKIPWAHVFGNHDSEQKDSISRPELQKVYESFEWCVSKAGDENVSGVGNYILPVLEHNSDKIAFNIWALDSGDYISGELKKQVMPVKSVFEGYHNSSYAHLKTDQVLWYYQSSILMEKENGKKIPGLMAFHIPIHEAYNAWVNRDGLPRWTGEKNEDICAGELNSGLFTAILDRGDIKAMVFGHDHVNDFMLDYCGVKLCYCSTVSSLCYWDEEMSGARVFIAHEDGSEIETYMTYLHERKPDIPPETAVIFQNSVILDFDSYTPEFVLTGFKDNLTEEAHPNEILAGISAGRGQDGGKALSVTREKYYGQAGSDNFEVKMILEKPGRLGTNKYLKVWMDLTGDTAPIDFRKANFGLIVNNRLSRAYCTDVLDEPSDFFYKADGSDEWVQMSHGDDGCFGTAQGSSVKGLKGWFAFPVQNMPQYGTKARLTENSVITGVYFFGCLSDASMAGQHIYLDNISLVEDYKK